MEVFYLAEFVRDVNSGRHTGNWREKNSRYTFEFEEVLHEKVFTPSSMKEVCPK